MSTRFWVRGLALAIIVIALFARLSSFHEWRDQSPFPSVAGLPALINPDGYFYLGLARDLAEGSYAEPATLRGVPDGAPRPWPPPLLSLSTWAVAASSPFGLHQVAIYLPALLSLMLAWPVYGLARHFASQGASLLAVMLALLSRDYVFRTTAGWYDTDAFNVSLTTWLSYLLLEFASRTGVARYRALAGAVFLYGIGLLWWDQARAVVTLAALVPLATALVFFYRPTRREGICAGASLAIVALLVAWLFGADIATSAWKNLGFLGGPSGFPSVGETIGELRPASALDVATHTVGLAGWIFVLAGLARMAARRDPASLFLAFPLALALLSFSAIRFVIFFAPITGIAVAVAADWLWGLREARRERIALLSLLVVLSLFPALGFFTAGNLWGLRPAAHYPTLEALSKSLPDDAVLWGHWAMGYPIEFYARRTAVSDASLVNGPQLFAINYPLAIANPRLAANFIHFYVARGAPGFAMALASLGEDRASAMDRLAELLVAGPQGAAALLRQSPPGESAAVGEWLAFLFPVPSRPVYLVLDRRTMGTIWFYNGSWSFETRAGTSYTYDLVSGVKKSPEGWLALGLSIDPDRGVAERDGEELPLSELRVVKRVRVGDGEVTTDRRVLRYSHATDYRAAVLKPARLAVLMRGPIANSLASRMYSELAYDDRYFRPTHVRPGEIGVFRVLGDVSSR